MRRAGFGHRVEGRHAVQAALEAGRVRHLTVQSSAAQGDLAGLVGRAVDGGCRVDLVDDVRTLAETSTPQGVVADCDPIRPVSLDELIDADDPSALVVMDHVQDPHNLGAIVRSCVAAGIPSIVVPDRRSAPLSAVAFKAAAGTLERAQVAVVSSVARALALLGDRHVWTVGLDASGNKSLFGLELFTEPVALVVGSEGLGMSRLVAETCDVLVKIPMADDVESLNASVAASLAVFEIVRSRTQSRPV